MYKQYMCKNKNTNTSAKFDFWVVFLVKSRFSSELCILGVAYGFILVCFVFIDNCTMQH